jgi:hypothetical protein
MVNTKRGLSTIVTTLIIILLVFIAIGIVWTVIQNVLTEGVENIDTRSFTLDLEISKIFIDPSSGYLTISVTRNSGIGEFQAIRFMVGDGTSTEVYDLPSVNFAELETRSFELSEYTGDVTNVKIAPVFISETGEEKLSKIVIEVILEETLNVGLINYNILCNQIDLRFMAPAIFCWSDATYQEGACDFTIQRFDLNGDYDGTKIIFEDDTSEIELDYSALVQGQTLNELLGCGQDEELDQFNCDYPQIQIFSQPYFIKQDLSIHLCSREQNVY